MVAQHSHSEFGSKLIKDTETYVSKLISKATAIEIKIKTRRILDIFYSAQYGNQHKDAFA